MRLALGCLLLLPLAAIAQEAQIVTSDIDNFWRAYDAGTPGNRTAAFQQLYFDQASPGLREF